MVAIFIFVGYKLKLFECLMRGVNFVFRSLVSVWRRLRRGENTSRAIIFDNESTFNIPVNTVRENNSELNEGNQQLRGSVSLDPLTVNIISSVITADE